MKINTTMLDTPKPGPGGHWFRYEAKLDPDDGTRGFGQTALEATKDLRAKVLKDA